MTPLAATAALSTAHLQLALARLDPLLPSMIGALAKDGRGPDAAQLACRLISPSSEARALLFAYLHHFACAASADVLVEIAKVANARFDGEVLAWVSHALERLDEADGAPACDVLVGMYLELVDHCPPAGAAFVASLLVEAPRTTLSSGVVSGVLLGLGTRIDPLAQRENLLLEVLCDANSESSISYALGALGARAPRILDELDLPTIARFAQDVSPTRRCVALQQLARAERVASPELLLSLAGGEDHSLATFALEALQIAPLELSPSEVHALASAPSSAVREFGALHLSGISAEALTQEHWVLSLAPIETRSIAAAHLASAWPLSSISSNAFADAWCGPGGDMLRELVALSEREPSAEQLVAVYTQTRRDGRPARALTTLLRRPLSEHDPEFVRTASQSDHLLAQAACDALLDEIPPSLHWTHFLLDRIGDPEMGPSSAERLLDERWPASLVPYAWVIESLSSFDAALGAFAERFFRARVTPDMLAAQSGSDRAAGLGLFVGLLQSPDVPVRRAVASALLERHPLRIPFAVVSAIMLHRDYGVELIEALLADDDLVVAQVGVELGLTMDEAFEAGDVLQFLQGSALESKRLGAQLLETRRGGRERSCFGLPFLLPLIESSEGSLRVIGMALLRGEAEGLDQAEGLARMLSSAHEDVIRNVWDWLREGVVDPSLLVEVASEAALTRFFARGLLNTGGSGRALIESKRSLFDCAKQFANVSFEFAFALARLCILMSRSEVPEEAEMANATREHLVAQYGASALESTHG